jgi:hypothetical protein
VAEGWRRLHNEKLHNLHASPNIIGVIKSGRMRRAKRVTHVGEIRNYIKFWSENKKEGTIPNIWV